MASRIDFSSDLARARSLLFVPGNRPERFVKALASGADAVVLDLEDSVPDAQKPMARDAISEALGNLSGRTIPVITRINTIQSDAGQADLDWLEKQTRLGGVMLAKTESARQLLRLRDHVSVLPLLPLIESAAGFVMLEEIAAVDGVLRLVIGHIDFMADTGIRCSDDERELAPLRFHVAMQTRMKRLAAPVDGVTVEIDNDSRLTADTTRALSFGFGGKLCIHPRQVAVVHQGFAPSPAELERALKVIEAARVADGAAVRVDGQMVDLPVVLQAQATIARAAR